MDLSAIGLGAAFSFGSKLGAQAASDTIGFAQLLTEKMSGQEPEPGAVEAKSAFEASLEKFDGMLEKLGLTPKEARTVEFSSDSKMWQVTVDASKLDAPSRDLIEQWQRENSSDCANMNLAVA